MTKSRHHNLLGRGIFLSRLGLSLSVALFTLVQLRAPEPANGQVSTSKRGVQDARVQFSAAAVSGTYYALVIGNDDYKYLPKLKTAVADANAIAQLLRERYGFTTNVLLDSSRNRILTALNEYRRVLTEDSYLLIYYAGHGHHDPDTDKAYWLPIDAQRDNNDNWISADDITSDIKAIPSQHILIISDSCYSGALTRDADVMITPQERTVYLGKMLKSKSRNLMSSGGDEPVADGGGPGHSVFAAAILESLRRIEQDQFTAAELFQRFVQPSVAGRSDQLPQYSLIRNSGHAFGDFVFFRKGGSKSASTQGVESRSSGAATTYGVLPAGPSDASRTTAPGISSPTQTRPDQQNLGSKAATIQGGGLRSTGPLSTNQTTQPVPGNPVGNVAAQRFVVLHYGGIDASQACVGEMWVDGAVIHYRAVRGTHGIHAYDFPAQIVKEVKKNPSILSAYQAFHVRLTSGEVYNFSLLDSSLKTFLNADSLLIAIHQGLGK